MPTFDSTKKRWKADKSLTIRREKMLLMVRVLLDDMKSDFVEFHFRGSGDQGIRGLGD